MSREEILAKLKEIIKPYVGDESLFATLTESSDLINDLKINSAHVVDIVLDIETEFDVVVDDESINKMTTISSSIDVVEKLLA
jgi:acyl carrier protein